jgi:hypothetical protein
VRSPARRWLLWLDIAAKLALLGLLTYAVVRRDLPQFEGKAFLGRSIAYPIAVAIVPAAWLLASRSRRREYPFDIDLLWTLPFLIDTAGNVADLYDSISWWDDANHFVNWCILVLASGLGLVRLQLPRWVATALAVGFGAVTAVLWEFAEYVTFIRNSPEKRTAYTDTLGDLALGLSGSVVAAALVAAWLWPAFKARR